MHKPTGSAWLPVVMNVLPPPHLTGIGLYPLPEAARLAQLDTRTARRWAEGYSFISHGERRVSPIELRQQHPDNDEPAVPRRARELIEVLTGQQAFADVVEPSLFADVDRRDDLASR